MKKILLLLLAGFAASPLLAYNWTEAGFTVVNDEDAPAGSIVLSDADGRSYIIENEEMIPDQIAVEIIKFIDMAKSWKHIKWQEMKFLPGKEETQFAVYPTAMTYRGENLLPYLPGGMTFAFEEALKYNFRMLKDKLFIKMTGIYIDEEMLLSKLAEAMKDPQAFIRRRDPDFFLSRIEALDAQNAALRRQVEKLTTDYIAFQNGRMFYSKSPSDEDKIRTVITYKTDNPKATVDEVVAKMKERKVDISKKEIEIVFGVYFNEFGK